MDHTGQAALGRSIAFAEVDADGTFRHVSERWCNLFGATVDALIGARWTDVVHADDHDRVLTACRQCAAQEEAVELEYRAAAAGPAGDADAGSLTTDAEDRERWIGASLHALGDRAGWLVTAADITDRRRAELLAARARRRLDKIVDSSSDVVAILDGQGRYVWASRVGAGLFGYQRGEIQPDAAFRLIHPDDRERAIAAFAERLHQDDGGRGPVRTYRVATADGSWRWLETISVNMLADPDVRGMVVHSRDVTERVAAAQELERANSRLATLVDNLHLAVVLVDANNRVLASNRAFTEMCGFSEPPEALIGLPEEELGNRIRPLLAQPDEYLAELDRLRQARVIDVHGDIEVVDGRVVERTYVPIGDGEDQGHLWIFRDQTEEKNAALERERLLEREQLQNERLRELDALKTDLAAAISHELRTPLTAIISFTELLQDGIGRDDAEAQQEFVDIVMRNSNRLLRLVDDLLLLGRLDDRTLPVVATELDVPDLVTMAVSSLRPTAEGRGISLECSAAGGPPLLADGERLGQLVDNLLGNAMKFTNAGGRVSVTAHPTADGWRLEVADTGIGIPERDLPELFERFFRASNAREQTISGSGLGLAIARGIAELHRGSITVDSVEGAGTTFTVLLQGVDPAATRATPAD